MRACGWCGAWGPWWGACACEVVMQASRAWRVHVSTGCDLCWAPRRAIVSAKPGCFPPMPSWCSLAVVQRARRSGPRRGWRLVWLSVASPGRNFETKQTNPWRSFPNPGLFLWGKGTRSWICTTTPAVYIRPTHNERPPHGAEWCHARPMIHTTPTHNRINNPHPNHTRQLATCNFKRLSPPPTKTTNLPPCVRT